MVSPIRSSSSWTWASWKTFSNIDTQDLCAEDYATIHSVIESYVGLFYAVGNKEHDHRAAAEILFGEDREDGDGSPDNIHRRYSGGGACGIAWGRCSRRKKMP